MPFPKPKLRANLGFLVLSLAFLSSGSPIAGADDCQKNFEAVKPAAAPPTSSAPPFRHWTFAKPPILKPNQILPEDFLQEVEATVGPLQLHRTCPPGKGCYYELTAGGPGNLKQVMTWGLYPVPGSPRSVRIDELVLENPIPSETTGALHLSQEKKGLPIPVFRHARDQLFALARAGNFTQLEAHGPQNFAVLMLYEKMVGMQGKTEAARERIAMVHGLYEFARKKLPEDLRPKTLDQFARTLGDANVPPPGILPMEKAWREHFRGAPLPEGVEVIHDDEGLPRVLVDRRSAGAHPLLYWIRPEPGAVSLVQWNRLLEGFDGGISLAREIPAAEP